MEQLFKEARWLIDECRAKGEDMTANTITGLLERAEKFLPDWANYQQGRADGKAEALESAAALCNAADKSTHPADLADAIRALIVKA